MLQFDEPQIVNRLAQFDRSDRTAFALACASRLDPLLDEVPPGDRELVRGCRKLLERAIATKNVEDAELSLALARLESLETLDVDAVASVAYAFRAWLTDSPQEAAWAARRAYDAWDLIAQSEHGGSGFDEQRLLAHPAVQRELEAQLTDLNGLSKEGA